MVSPALCFAGGGKKNKYDSRAAGRWEGRGKNSICISPGTWGLQQFLRNALISSSRRTKFSIVYITLVDKANFFLKISFISVYLPPSYSICDSCQSNRATHRLINSALSCENNSYMQGWLISCKMPSHATSPDPDLPHLKVFCLSGCEIFPGDRITGYYVNIYILNMSLFHSSCMIWGSWNQCLLQFCNINWKQKSITVATWRQRRSNLSWFAENLRF